MFQFISDSVIVTFKFLIHFDTISLQSESREKKKISKFLYVIRDLAMIKFETHDIYISIETFCTM